MSKSIEADVDSDLEAWRNAMAGRVVVTKFGADGKLRSELVSSGKVIHLSPAERKINQEAAANEDLDVFLNGCLQPVRLVKGDKSSEEMASHPNHLTDEEALALFRGPKEQFVERLATITNAAAVQRLLDLAEDPSTGASFQQHELVQARLEVVAVQPMQHIRGHAPARDGRPALDVGGEGMPNAVTPR